MNILIIVPAYNEEQNIVATIDNLKTNLPAIDYIVINDGSRDGTAALLDKEGINHLDMPVNVGLTVGMRTGFKYALLKGYDAAIQFDGDGQHDARYIKDMIKEFESDRADIIIGSRYVQKKKSGMTLRNLGGSLITACIKLTTGKKISDPTSGMRLYSRKVMERYMQHLNYSPEPDTLALLMNRGFRVSEIPVIMRERKFGKSYLSSFHAIKYMLHTIVSIIIIQWICE